MLNDAEAQKSQRYEVHREQVLYRALTMGRRAPLARVEVHGQA